MSSFTQSLLVSPLPDGGRWVVRGEFGYDVGEKDSGDRISVPIGFVTDFASIPRMFWKILPKWGKYGNAAVIHDYLYWEGIRPRKECDDIFLEGMEVWYVPLWIRYPMYWAVRWFGSFTYGQEKRKAKKMFVTPLLEMVEIHKMDLKVFEGY